MRVSIDCDADSGEWYLRQFAGPLVPESFQVPADLVNAIEVPDYVVAAYCMLQAQDRSMQFLLGQLYDQHEAQTQPSTDRQD
jgi:hypothetical protein